MNWFFAEYVQNKIWYSLVMWAFSERWGFICWSIRFFVLLAVQGALKSLHQHQSSKASVWYCPAFTSIKNQRDDHSLIFVCRDKLLHLKILSSSFILVLRVPICRISGVLDPPLFIIDPSRQKLPTISTSSPSVVKWAVFHFVMLVYNRNF